MYSLKLFSPIGMEVRRDNTFQLQAVVIMNFHIGTELNLIVSKQCIANDSNIFKEWLTNKISLLVTSRVIEMMR